MKYHFGILQPGTKPASVRLTPTQKLENAKSDLVEAKASFKKDLAEAETSFKTLQEQHDAVSVERTQLQASFEESQATISTLEQDAIQTK